MRVGICLLTLTPGEMGGTETYARELLRGLERVGGHDYCVLLPDGPDVKPEGLDVAVATGYRPQHRRVGRGVTCTRAALHSRALRERLGPVDVTHYPLTVPLPRPSGAWVTTLHDVLHLDHPELLPATLRLFRRLGYDRAARNANRVIVISEFVRERAIDRLGLDPERVTVIPLGIAHDRLVPGVDAREPLLLYPARLWPHKNHARLFEAFTRLRRGRPELRLVLTGGGHEGAALPEGVESRGLVSDDELARLYRRAACLVFPSLYEGFGLPPLEAMACGCPVAASRAGAIPETCGDAAVLFDAYDPAAIAVGIEEALARADELRARGLEHAALFTWEATAQAHDEVYRRLA